MAVDAGDIVFQIAGDTAELNKAVKEAETIAKAAAKEIAAAQKAAAKEAADAAKSAAKAAAAEEKAIAKAAAAEAKALAKQEADEKKSLAKATTEAQRNEIKAKALAERNAILETSRLAKQAAAEKKSAEKAAADAAKQAAREVAAAQKAAAQQSSQAWAKFHNDMSAAGQRISQVFSTVSRSAGVAATAAGTGIAAGLVSAAKSAMTFESAMAEVQKSVGVSGKELKDFGAEIRKMSLEIPVAADELAGIAAAAGQFGIQKDAIMAFTRVIADLGVASDLTGEEGASMLAGFATITQMDQSKFSNLASAIVALGNDGAATEKEIASMALRLAAAGEQAGMSEADIVGIASALSSLKIESEAGGTAFSKLIIDISANAAMGGEQLQTLADVAGMTADEFANMAKEAPTDALVAFFTGLQRIKNEGGNLFLVMEQLQFTEVRMRDAILRAAGAGDILTSSITKSNTAFTQNTALTKEAEARYATTESRLQILKNTFTDLGISLGEWLLPRIQEMTRWMAPLVTKISEWAAANPGLAASLMKIGIAAASLLIPLGMFLFFLPSIVALFFSMIMVVNLVGSAVLALAAAFPIVWGIIAAVVAAALTGMLGSAESFGAALKAMWNNLPQAASDAWNAVSNYIIDALKKAGVISEEQAIKMSQDWGITAEDIKYFTDMIGVAFVTAWQAAYNAMLPLIDKVNYLLSLLGMLAGALAGAGLGTGLAGPLGGVIGGVAGAAGGYYGMPQIPMTPYAMPYTGSADSKTLGKSTANVNINMGGVTVRNEQDAAMLSKVIAKQLRQEMRGMGYAT